MADTVGNRLGERATFVYLSDDGDPYNVTLDRSVGVGVGNAISTDGTAFVLKTSQSRPIKPRYVLMSLNSDPRVTKKAIIGNIANPLWTLNVASPVTINGAAYTITTRVGERRSVLRLSTAPAA